MDLSNLSMSSKCAVEKYDLHGGHGHGPAPVAPSIPGPPHFFMQQTAASGHPLDSCILPIARGLLGGIHDLNSMSAVHN